MTRFTADTEAALRAAGWYPGRNIQKDIQLFNNAQIPPKAIKIYQEFGHLRFMPISLNRKMTEQLRIVIWMDIDSAPYSQKLRIEYALNHGKTEEEKLLHLDSIAPLFERKDEISTLQKKYHMDFVRICHFNSDLYDSDGDLYMSEKGELYLFDDDTPYQIYHTLDDEYVTGGTFDDFLNIILDPTSQETIVKHIKVNKEAWLGQNLKGLLEKAGWHDERNIQNRTYFPPNKKIFYEACQIYNEFGMLDIKFKNKNQSKTSCLSMSIIPKDFEILELNRMKVDYRQTYEECDSLIEKMELTETTHLEKILKRPCHVIGFLKDDFFPGGWNWVIVNNLGHIYLSGEGLYMTACTFKKFLAKWSSDKRRPFWEKI